MARRNESLVDVLLEIATKLPWWVDVVIAIVAYFGLHDIATTEVVAATFQPGKIGAFIAPQLFKSLAMPGQYLLPLIFLLGAIVSFIKRKKREQLLSVTKQRGKQSALLDMTWREFEMLVGEAFRVRGFSVVETGGNGPDGGIDLILKKDNEIHLVQCKQWKAYKVGVDVVRQLFGVMTAKGAVSGYVVTSGEFTNAAREFANGCNIHLIDGNKLTQFIQGVKIITPVVAASSGLHSGTQPVCPKCGGAMARRTARQGPNVGNEFWGCSKYPLCKGIRSI